MENKTEFTQKKVSETPKYKYTEREKQIIQLLQIAFENKPEDSITFILDTKNITYHNYCYDLKILNNIIKMRDTAGTHFMLLKLITKISFCNKEEYRVYTEALV